jgi:chromosome segregation ATPase
MDSTVISTGVSVDKVLELQQQVNNLNAQLLNKEREVGATNAHIHTLEDQVSELKEKLEQKAPEVRIVTVTKKQNSWGDTYNDSTIEYKNLSSVQDDIRKELETKFKKDLEKSEATIKDLNKQLEASEEKHSKEVKIIKSNYDDYSLQTRLDYEERERSRKEKLEKKDLEIKKLNEELEKVKNDKTDEQLVAAREEEISLLNKRIAKLEEIIKYVKSLNIFKRLFATIVISDGDTRSNWFTGRKEVWDSVYKTWRKVRINPTKE